MYKKIVDDKVYPVFSVKYPGASPADIYFDWQLPEPSDGKSISLFVKERFRFWYYPDHLAYFIKASELSKFKRQELFDYYEKMKAYFESFKCEVGELRFHRIREEICIEESYKTLEELDADPRPDEEWR